MMEHPDVVKLENRLNRVWEERDTAERREELKKELDVDENIPAQMFFCSKCNEDYYPVRVVKTENRDWNTEGIFRYWRAKHSCGKWNIRLITQKVRDSFFRKSPSILRDRRINKLDTIQPQETGFNMLYGRKTNTL